MPTNLGDVARWSRPTYDESSVGRQSAVLTASGSGSTAYTRLVTDRLRPGLARNLWVLGPVAVAAISVMPMEWLGSPTPNSVVVQPTAVFNWSASIAGLWFA